MTADPQSSPPHPPRPFARSLPARIAAALLLVVPVIAQDRAEPERADPGINELLSAYREGHDIPGISCAVVHAGRELFAGGVGVSDVENDVPATAATVYRLASISKPIAAVLAMQLVERGELDLDAAVHTLVPQWPQKRWPVTTRQLLGHLGGVRHYKRGEGECTTHYDSQLEGLERFAADPLLHEPGTKFRYSTFGFNLVAAVVEARAERTFADVLRERISEPCGAVTLQDDDVRRIIRHRAQGYVRVGGELRNSRLMDASYKLGGGGLCASAPDLARFARALMAGELVSQQTLATMWTAQRTKAGEATGYGLGFSVAERDGRRVVAHSGAQSRVSTMLLLLPDERLGVVLLCNLEGVKLRGLAERIADAVLAQEGVR